MQNLRDQSARMLVGKRIVVTGGANGIGRGVVMRFLREGAQVIALDNDAPALAEVRSAVGSDATLSVVEADVTAEEEIAGAIADACERLGGLDGVIANAAIEPIARDTEVHLLDADVLRAVVDVNLVGMALTCKHGVKALLESGGGAVVCTGSPTGLLGASPDEAAYSLSKSGTIGLVRTIASRYGRRGIRANAVLPGFMRTRINDFIYASPELLEQMLETIPLGRGGEVDEVAAVMAFLASDLASYVTGAIWAADGGITAV